MAGPVLSFSDLWGNQGLVNGLRRALESGRVAHAYLFVGPEGSGKAAVARALAGAILCEQGGPEPCRQCSQCRMLAGDGHPDLHEVEPEGLALKIDQIREVRRLASLRPYMAATQVFVIHHVESLTDQAANSFLKLLEEPPEGTHLILLADRAGSVLPTILSRCQAWQMQRLSVNEMQDNLKRAFPELPDEEVRRIAFESGGRPEKAREMATPEARALYQEQIRLCMHVLTGEPPELLAVAEEMDKNRARVEKLLEGLAAQFDAALRSANERAARSSTSPAGEGCPFTEAGDLIALLEEVALARRLLKANVNARLTLDVLFLEIYSRRTRPA